MNKILIPIDYALNFMHILTKITRLKTSLNDALVIWSQFNWLHINNQTTQLE